MEELYCEKYYDDEELAFVQEGYGLVLKKEFVDAANEFFRAFYKAETTYCKKRRYQGYALDVFLQIIADRWKIWRNSIPGHICRRTASFIQGCLLTRLLRV